MTAGYLIIEVPLYILPRAYAGYGDVCSSESYIVQVPPFSSADCGAIGFDGFGISARITCANFAVGNGTIVDNAKVIDAVKTTLLRHSEQKSK